MVSRLSFGDRKLLCFKFSVPPAAFTRSFRNLISLKDQRYSTPEQSARRSEARNRGRGCVLRFGVSQEDQVFNITTRTGRKSHCVIADVSVEADVQQMVNEVAEHFGELNVS